jgi:uncharacterized RDD family membrane protein YckC
VNYSSINRRIFAMLLDWAIILIPIAVAIHVIPIIGGVILIFFYYPVFESSRLQATIGKHLMGIQVADEAGGRLTFRTACLRLLIKLASMTCLFLGHVLALFTQRHQALHDLVANSVVVYGRQEISIADAWVEQIRSIFSSSARS